MPTAVTVTNIDNETAGFLLAGSASNTITESGGSATFTVVLTSQPSDVVTVTPSSSDATEMTVGPASLSFTTSDWNVPQTVTVTGVDDNIVDGNQTAVVRWAATSSNDAAYAALTIPDVNVMNVDDDRVVILVGALSRPTTEAGGQGTFTIELASRPLADVTVPFSSSDVGEGTVNLGSVTFTDQNWDTPQAVTVSGVDDNIADGTVIFQIDFAASVSTDSNYNALIAPSLLVPNLDDDVVGVVVTGPSSPTSEAGGTATASISLSSQPSSDVTINLTSSDTTEGSVNPSSITIQVANWNQAHMVTITGIDDAIADSAQTYRVATRTFLGLFGPALCDLDLGSVDTSS